MPDAHVNWYEDDVVLAIDQATDEILTKLAFFVEGEYKVHARVATGFMRNSAYAITPLASHRMQAQAEANAVADRDLAPQPMIEEGDAAVHVAAEYAIYNEMQDHALYRALEKAQGIAGGVIQDVGRSKLR